MLYFCSRLRNPVGGSPVCWRKDKPFMPAIRFGHRLFQRPAFISSKNTSALTNHLYESTF